MAVVINEFEVVPESEAPPAPPAASAAPPAEPPGAREIEPAVAHLLKRALRAFAD